MSVRVLILDFTVRRRKTAVVHTITTDTTTGDGLRAYHPSVCSVPRSLSVVEDNIKN